MVVNLFIFVSKTLALTSKYTSRSLAASCHFLFINFPFSISQHSHHNEHWRLHIPFIIYFPIILIFANQSRFFFCSIFFVVVAASWLHFIAGALDREKNLTVIYSLINSKLSEECACTRSTHKHTHRQAGNTQNRPTIFIDWITGLSNKSLNKRTWKWVYNQNKIVHRLNLCIIKLPVGAIAIRDKKRKREIHQSQCALADQNADQLKTNGWWLFGSIHELNWR